MNVAPPTDAAPVADTEHTDGIRQQLVAALQADNPHSVLRCVGACKSVVVTSLRDESRSAAYKNSTEEGIDGVLGDCLTKLTSEENLNKLANPLKTITFAVAMQFDCVQVATLMLSDAHRGSVDPTYKIGKFRGGNPVIYWACMHGRTHIVKQLLLDQRVDPSEDENAILRYSIMRGHLEVAKLLLADARVDPSIRKNIILHEACKKGQTEIVQLLLAEARVSCAGINTSIIEDASINGHIEVVKLLLADSRINPATSANFAVRSASEYGHTEVVKVLMADPRVDPSALGNAAIRDACDNGHVEVVKLLFQDSRVNPAFGLKLACQNGHTDIVNMLLHDTRVDPSFKDQSAFKQALKEGHVGVIKLLVQDPRVVISKAMIIFGNNGNVIQAMKVNFLRRRECCKVLLDAYPHFWPELIDDLDISGCVVGAPLRSELQRLQIVSSWVLMLCVKQLFSSKIAARVGDVLREVCEEWTSFGKKEE